MESSNCLVLSHLSTGFRSLKILTARQFYRMKFSIVEFLDVERSRTGL